MAQLTSRSQFEYILTINPRDIGYDNDRAPRTDAELFAVYTPDRRGNAKTIAAEIRDRKAKLNGTYHRVVIRRCATGETMGWIDFLALGVA